MIQIIKYFNKTCFHTNSYGNIYLTRNKNLYTRINFYSKREERTYIFANKKPEDFLPANYIKIANIIFI